MNWALRRCSLYEVNSVCYAQFSLSFNNFFKFFTHTMSGNCHLKTVAVDHHVWIIGRTQSSQMRQQTLRSPWSIDRQPALWSRQGASCDPRFTKTMRCEHQRGPRRTGIFKVHYHQTPSSTSSVKSAGHAGFLQAVCTLILLSLRWIPKGSDSPFFW